MCKVCNRTIRRPTNDSQKAETGMVRPCRKINRTYQGDPARHSERRQKERETEKEMGGQHKGLDRPKNIRVIENSGEQRGMEKTDCQILSGAPTDKGLRDWKWKWRPWHRMLGTTLLVFFVAVVQISSVTPVIHTLNYFTTVSQVAKLPEFLEVAYVDGVQILHFDSNHRETKAKHDWVNKITEDNPYFWETETAINIMNEQMMKRNIETAKKRFNQTGGVHMIQVMKGCEWDNETDEVDGWEHYCYDGEDFLSFEAKTMTWIAAHPQAFITKLKLDQMDGFDKVMKISLTEKCPFLLKEHLRNGRVFLTRTELPKVSLLQKTPSSPVTCHATGFYPRTSSLFWRKNGEEIHEDVEMGATLPNHDGTFQTSAHLKVVVTLAAEQEYDCVFQLDGLPEDIVIKLDAASILSNARIREQDREKAWNVAGIVLSLLGIAMWLVDVVLYKHLKRNQVIYFLAWKEEEEEENVQLNIHPGGSVEHWVACPPHS